MTRRGGPRPNSGPKPRAGTLSTETLRFRCTEAEAAEIDAALEAAGRDLSDVARELLLAWVRRAAPSTGPRRKRCPRCNQLLYVVDGAIERHQRPSSPFGECV